ncbi:MAG: hypothetical protein OEZ39_05520 [Gammaproteobacteria bacterium]|nr:hypothetical protein [Gammaproteobacteria bacterium]MDH5651314.1 hypothetical protein [Gammaproteobacteria bacterium]
MTAQQNKSLTRTTDEEVPRYGIVHSISVDGVITVTDLRLPNMLIDCLFLRNSAASLPEINIGDRVLYLPAGEKDAPGCVMGLIEPYKTSRKALEEKLSAQSPCSVTALEDEVVRIKADKGLVIECGKGSIIITADGKLQIKGTDLLSRSRGINRIKGAGVNIN